MIFEDKNVTARPQILSLTQENAVDLHSVVYSPLTLRKMVMGKHIQGGSNMTGTDLCVNKPRCAAAVRP